jgi:GGDEF domain-containing protein
MVGIDDFEPWVRSSNDGEVGKVVRSVTAVLCPVIRQTDLLARVDEGLFALCLIDCNMAGGVLVVDRIDGILDSVREETGLRFSIGGAVFDTDMDTPDDLRSAARGSLENARAKGGDQVDFHH